jgi:hypothetical protein
MRVWGGAVASGHVALGLAGWLLIGVPPWFFGGCALLTLGVALLAAPLLHPRDDGPGDDGGGLGPRPEEPEPPWWPEFERELREYMRASDRVPA